MREMTRFFISLIFTVFQGKLYGVFGKELCLIIQKKESTMIKYFLITLITNNCFFPMELK